MYKKVAIIERVYRTTSGDTAFMCDDVMSSKPKLQSYLNNLKRFGEVSLTDYRYVDVDVKKVWKGEDMYFITLEELREDSTLHKTDYRIRMKELDRYV